ncbi:hypothetical protein JCM10450v2_006226 [Rhodotorula kratochvilovae]
MDVEVLNLATDGAEGAHPQTQQPKVSLLDLPDELVALVFHYVRDSYRHDDLHPRSVLQYFDSAPLSLARLNKRIWRIVGATWAYGVQLPAEGGHAKKDNQDRALGRLLSPSPATESVRLFHLNLPGDQIHTRLALLSHYRHITHLSLTFDARPVQPEYIASALRARLTFDDLPQLEVLDIVGDNVRRISLHEGATRLKHVTLALVHTAVPLSWLTLHSVKLHGTALPTAEMIKFAQHAEAAAAQNKGDIPLSRLSLDLNAFGGVGSAYTWPQLLDMVSRIAAVAPSLETLEIGRFSQLRDAHRSTATREAFSSITTLVLYGRADLARTEDASSSHRDPFYGLLQFLALFPSLETLVIGIYVLKSDDLHIGLETYASPPAKLAVAVPHLYALLAVLRETELRTLVIRDTFPCDDGEVRWERCARGDEFVRERYYL